MIVLRMAVVILLAGTLTYLLAEVPLMLIGAPLWATVMAGFFSGIVGGAIGVVALADWIDG